MIKKYFYKIYEKILGKFDDNDGKLLRQYYKKRFGVDVGKHSYGMDFSNIAQGTKIGAFCSIASGVKIGLMNHPMQYVSTNPFLYYKNRGFVEKDIHIAVKMGSYIGNDVWIGNNAVILPGVNIDNGSIIAAGAVVTKDVSPYEIVGGVPAKHLKFRFDENIRSELNKIDWYNWPDNKIRENLELFYNPSDFIDKFRQEMEPKDE